MKEIYTVAIQKGGTGKTTTAATLTHAAADRGQRVLAIDLDPQGQLSYTLGADTSQPGSYELLEGAAAVDLLQKTETGAHVIPASWNLATITSGKGSARRLQNAIKPILKYYDVIIIDTPPTAGELQYNALQAATGLLIPLQADIFSLQSLYQIIDTANQIKASNKGLELLGVIMTQFNPRTTLSRQMLEKITEVAEGAGVKNLWTVRKAVAVQEAEALQRSLFDYAPKSKPAQDYKHIYDYLYKQQVRKNLK